jgi:S1-C subfamily serine protease
MKRPVIGVLLGAFALGGCVDPLVALAIDVGASAIIAGVDAATSDTGSSDVEAYCWDPEKQSASTSTSPNCWSTEVKITEDEYEKFKDTGVAPHVSAVALNSASVSRQRYCVNPQETYFYVLTSECAAGDTSLPEDEWRSRHAAYADKVQAAASVPAYCWDSRLSLEYKSSSGYCGNDRRITEEQYQTQRARREEAKKADQEAKIADQPQPPAAPVPPPTKKAEPPKEIATPATDDTVSASKTPALPQQVDISAFDIPGSGTGFVVSSFGHLLTNEHVVSKCDTMATVAGGGVYEASIVDTHKRYDLAVLKLPFGVDKVATFAAASPEQGDDVFVVGYPLLEDFREIKITNGIVSGLSGPDHDTSLLQMTAAVQPGNSGGPLVNANGSVVGVVVGKYTGEIGGGFYAEGINFAVSQDAAADFLSANGVVIKRSNASKELKGREIMRRASTWTVPLLCLTRKAPS